MVGRAVKRKMQSSLLRMVGMGSELVSIGGIGNGSELGRGEVEEEM